MRKMLHYNEEKNLPSSSIFVNIARGAVWLLGVCIMLSTCYGVDVSAAITALGIGGIAISLGFQDTIANLIGGLQAAAHHQARRQHRGGLVVRRGEGHHLAPHHHQEQQGGGSRHPQLHHQQDGAVDAAATGNEVSLPIAVVNNRGEHLTMRRRPSSTRHPRRRGRWRS